MIIQCVKCSTRFSVDSALIVGVENPNFHCSRCDHYFFLDEISLDNKNPVKDPPPPPSHRQLNFLDQGDSKILDGDEDENGEENKTSQKASWPDAVEDQDYETLYRPDSFSPDSVTNSENLSSHSLETSKTDIKGTSVEETISFKKKLSSKLNRFNSESKNTIPAEKTTPKPERISSRNYKSKGLSLNKFRNFSLSNIFKNDKTVSAKKDISREESSLKIKEQIKSKVLNKSEADLSIPKELKEKTELLSKVKNTPNVYQKTPLKIAYILLVPVIGLFGIYILNKNIDSLPSIAKIYLALAPGNLSTIPAPGVEIASLYSYKKNLDDGHKYLEFSGEILNSSPYNLEEAVVEVRLFDKTGKLLSQDLSSTKNKLANTKSISALPSDAIKNLKTQSDISGSQKQDSSVLGNIKPNGSRARFRNIILEPDEKAYWFSARVYSTKNKNLF